MEQVAERTPSPTLTAATAARAFSATRFTAVLGRRAAYPTISAAKAGKLKPPRTAAILTRVGSRPRAVEHSDPQNQVEKQSPASKETDLSH